MASGQPGTQTARARLHRQIREEFQTIVSAFFRRDPEYVADEEGTRRADATVRETLVLLERVLLAVDRYYVSDQPPTPENTTAALNAVAERLDRIAARMEARIAI